MPLPPKIQEVLDDLAFFPDRAERINYLIDLADHFQPAPPERLPDPLPEQNRVPGCESEAFLFTSLDPQNTLQIDLLVQNPQGMSAMAMGHILKTGLEGLPAAAAQEVPEEIVYQIFGRELSMGKSMGLTNMVRLLKSQAARL